ncbi:hypothetical protein ABEF95_005413 [Exophiala dermatitidis]
MSQIQLLDSLSASRLRALKTTETITILYKPTSTSEPLILAESFPLGIATTFSTKWNTEIGFPPINKMKVSELQRKPIKKSVTITGGRVNIHKHILSWMISCCEGIGIQRFTEPAMKPFAYLYHARVCAAIMGCEYLQHKIEKRMEQMAAGQIHSEDVRCLFLSVEPQVDEDMKRFLAEHVAIRIWEKRLKAKGAYRTLREEIPEFNKMIDEILGKKVEQRKMEWEARKKKRLAGQGQGQAQGNHGLNGRSSGATYGRSQGSHALNVNGPERSSGALAAYDGKPGRRVSGTAGKGTLTPTPTPAPTEPKAQKVSTVKVQSPVVRRGKNGRPAFVRFDLGVTRDGVRAAGGQM